MMRIKIRKPDNTFKDTIYIFDGNRLRAHYADFMGLEPETVMENVTVPDVVMYIKTLCNEYETPVFEL